MNTSNSTNRLSIFAFILLSLFILTVLLSCGGGGDSSSDNDSGQSQEPPPQAPQTLIGVLMDAPVANVSYETASGESGTTNSDGEFEYKNGDTVTFTLGGITFPTIAAAETITPLEIFNTDDFENNSVVNTLRLFQTLDDDGDTTQNIAISEAAINAINGAGINLETLALSPDEFAKLPEVRTMLASLAHRPALISSAQAVEHFKLQLGVSGLQGSWLLNEDNKKVIISFINSEDYIVVNQQHDVTPASVSAEYGSYKWHPVNGELILTSAVKSDEHKGLGSLFGETPTYKLQITDQQLNISTSAQNNKHFNRVDNEQFASVVHLIDNQQDRRTEELITWLSTSEYVSVRLTGELSHFDNIEVIWRQASRTTQTPTTASTYRHESVVNGDVIASDDTGYEGAYEDATTLLHRVNGTLTHINTVSGSQFTARVLDTLSIEVFDVEGDTQSVQVLHGKALSLQETEQYELSLQLATPGTSGQYNPSLGKTAKITLQPNGAGYANINNKMAIVNWHSTPSGELNISLSMANEQTHQFSLTVVEQGKTNNFLYHATTYTEDQLQYSLLALAPVNTAVENTATTDDFASLLTNNSGDKEIVLLKPKQGFGAKEMKGLYIFGDSIRDDTLLLAPNNKGTLNRDDTDLRDIEWQVNDAGDLTWQETDSEGQRHYASLSLVEHEEYSALMKRSTDADMAAKSTTSQLVHFNQAEGQVTYRLVANPDTWPTDKKEKIIAAMDKAIAIYNQYGILKKSLTIEYNAKVQTADAGYAGHIRFGGSISWRTALHEIGHTMGVGTGNTWDNNRSGGLWTGELANNMLKHLNGENARLGSDRSHFWPYGLNFSEISDGEVKFLKHVQMVTALAKDMKLGVVATPKLKTE